MAERESADGLILQEGRPGPFFHLLWRFVIRFSTTDSLAFRSYLSRSQFNRLLTTIHLRQTSEAIHLILTEDSKTTSLFEFYLYESNRLH